MHNNVYINLWQGTVVEWSSWTPTIKYATLTIKHEG